MNCSRPEPRLSIEYAIGEAAKQLHDATRWHEEREPGESYMDGVVEDIQLAFDSILHDERTSPTGRLAFLAKWHEQLCCDFRRTALQRQENKDVDEKAASRLNLKLALVEALTEMAKEESA